MRLKIGVSVKHVGIFLFAAMALFRSAEASPGKSYDEYLGASVVLEPDAEVFVSQKRENGWRIYDKVLESLPVLGTAHCKGGFADASPIQLFDSSKGAKVVHSIACSNINDWLASEKEGRVRGSLGRAVIVLKEEGAMFQVVLAKELLASEVTRKKVMNEFPRLDSWRANV